MHRATVQDQIANIAYLLCPSPLCFWLQYVVEAHYTGEEHELAGAAQQQVVGHKERYIPGPPSTVNYSHGNLYM